MFPKELRPWGTVSMKNPEMLYQALWCRQCSEAQREPWSTARAGISAGAKMIGDVEVCPWEIASFKWIVRRVLGTCHQM